MKKKTIVLSAVAAAFVLSVGCATAFAAESDAFSYLTGQQNNTSRNVFLGGVSKGAERL